MKAFTTICTALLLASCVPTKSIHSGSSTSHGLVSTTLNTPSLAESKLKPQKEANLPKGLVSFSMVEYFRAELKIDQKSIQIRPSDDKYWLAESDKYLFYIGFDQKRALEINQSMDDELSEAVERDLYTVISDSRPKAFFIKILNKSSSPLGVLWNESRIKLPFGSSSSFFHYTPRTTKTKDDRISSIVPSGGSLEEMLYPGAELPPYSQYTDLTSDTKPDRLFLTNLGFGEKLELNLVVEQQGKRENISFYFYSNYEYQKF